ncbi:oxygen-insensitive NADPH nitroreductase [Paenibacillus doosanensis]|uniref:FMN reductase (NADPH) n=1 Tax=Paenibacillus konkukensis TaxID=2020716 RepID=A0ABY4RU51_9BACL|nr:MULTISPECIES: oxygen-insensitive NADPH nitroreductase [Paenibacillus]MCS7463903.1 oxygen-insensitive NADPH nitroreductase [Paenibacillus doosanensis]UQZ85770.1 FMN reductase (NADPH) [Paenibacillus konkukensis]
MNPTIELLRSHRSIRKFKPDALTSEQIEAIISSAQMASSSSNVQAYSIIGVTDPGLKQELARLAGNQAYIEQCGLFLVFVADLHRLKEASALHGQPFHHNTESFLVATVDATLAAQNAAIAAESLGLGICYIGGIRNNPQNVCELLQLPELTYPVYGMCVGVPDQEPSHRPRLPRQAVYHSNRYHADKAAQGTKEYDETMYEYYRERTGGKTLTTWSQGIADKYAKPGRAHIRPFLDSRGFKLE